MRRIATALARGRRAAQARMGAPNGGSDVNVRRAASLGNQGAGGTQGFAWETVLASEPVRLAAGGWGSGPAQEVQVPTGAIHTPVRTCSFKWDTAGLQDGDLIEVIAGDCIGQVLQIVDVAAADQRTALRVPVIGAERPPEWDQEVES